MVGIFWVAKISNIFWGVSGRCWARAYVWRKNESTPPPGTFPLNRYPEASISPELNVKLFCIVPIIVVVNISNNTVEENIF